MKGSWLFPCGWWLSLVFSLVTTAQAELLINEILFNPPGLDSTNEYIELRGTPNLVIPEGTYLVSIEGDSDGNPGTVQNLFNLSGLRIGQNGFLVLLQKFHRYRPNPLSTVITNSDSGQGWGSGSSSSVHHRGEDGQNELENASCTFFLIQTDMEPSIGDDIDSGNNGVPDGAEFASWTILDSVGILDNDGDGDIAYGKINFRRDRAPGNDASASGNVVPVPFTAAYVARNGNSTDWTPTNWVASGNLLGNAPRWFLGGNSATLGTNTFPANRAKAALNHLGSPNFKAPVIPSVIVRESGTNTLVSRGGLKDSYLLNLSTRPAGGVTIQVDAELPLEVSTDGGRTYGARRTFTATTTTSRKVLVRAPDDGMVGPSSMTALINQSVIATLDPTRYPLDTIVRPVSVTVLDPKVVLLSEAKVNPPGSQDAPYEFVEIKGPPSKVLTNLFLLSVQGNGSGNPGRADLVVNLTGQRFGTNGLLMVAAPGNPYSFAPGTSVLLAPPLAAPGGALDNGSVSLLLVGSSQPISQGADLDNGNNGTLEGLPKGAVILDAIGWSNGGNGDEIYGGVDLTQHSFTPDAATRLPTSDTPRSLSSWMVGDLAGASGDSLIYDSSNISSNLPLGSVMTPGIVNRSGPRLSPAPLRPVSGVIGDPANEVVTFTVSDPDSPAATLIVTATSANQAVVPNANLTLTPHSGGRWTLALEPVGVGYSDIILQVSDGLYQRVGLLHYAASVQGRPGGQWHTWMSDASTAIAIDANWMFVGNDEDQVLRIFSRTNSGPPVAARDFSSLLALVDFYDDGRPKEVDIEASTRVGNRIFWLGSHSHAFNATERTNRARLFATDLSGSGTNAHLTFLGHYDFLKLDLLAWDANNLHGKGANHYGLAASAAIGVDPKAPDGSGFNLEGLCMAPGSTTNAYIAFRAPLVPPANRANALLIPVRNFAQLATRGGAPGSARFGTPIELNLGGRGVRSIEGTATNYLIIAGPPGAGQNLPPPGNFKLFTWTGNPADQPQQRDTDLTGLNPEGIVELPPGSWTPLTQFQLVSDNGTNKYYGDDLEAKHLPIPQFKKFRTDRVALGNVTSSALIKSVVLSDAVTTVSWLAAQGTTYRLQTKSGLDRDWIDIPGDVLATNGVAYKTLAPTPDPQCFFRVISVR